MSGRSPRASKRGSFERACSSSWVRTNSNSRDRSPLAQRGTTISGPNSPIVAGPRSGDTRTSRPSRIARGHALARPARRTILKIRLSLEGDTDDRFLPKLTGLDTEHIVGPDLLDIDMSGKFHEPKKGIVGVDVPFAGIVALEIRLCHPEPTHPVDVQVLDDGSGQRLRHIS